MRPASPVQLMQGLCSLGIMVDRSDRCCGSGWPSGQRYKWPARMREEPHSKQWHNAGLTHAGPEQWETSLEKRSTGRAASSSVDLGRQPACTAAGTLQQTLCLFRNCTTTHTAIWVAQQHSTACYQQQAICLYSSSMCPTGLPTTAHDNRPSLPLQLATVCQLHVIALLALVVCTHLNNHRAGCCRQDMVSVVQA